MGGYRGGFGRGVLRVRHLFWLTNDFAGGYGPDPYGPMMNPYGGYGGPPPPMQGGSWIGGGFTGDFGCEC